MQKPITHSTFERLYQLRSNRTISPAAGRCSTYRWKYHWVRSRSVGLGSATTRTVRGLVRSVIRLITPPLPAEPRPSKITSTLQALALDPVLQQHQLLLQPLHLRLVDLRP